MDIRIKVYGTAWCPDCFRAKQVLDRCQVKYDWIDIEKDPAAADDVMRVNRGHRSVPTIIFPDGTILVEPSNTELENQILQKR
jgi:mycoredoxin